MAMVPEVVIMEFFNRIGDFAKNVGDRTNDMLEIGKLNSRIHGEEEQAEFPHPRGRGRH